jgi:hypothetical protein
MRIDVAEREKPSWEMGIVAEPVGEAPMIRTAR